jgi:predicted DNA-binding protein
LYRKQLSKTVSTRLQNEMYDKLSSECNEKGVTVNEFLKECIDLRFENSELELKHVEEKLSAKELARVLGIKMD